VGVFAQRPEKLDPHVGANLVGTAAAWEQEGIDHGEIRPIIGRDETFLAAHDAGVMELTSGLLVGGRGGGNRTYDHLEWLGQNRGSRLWVWRWSYLVSDRG